MICQHLNQLTYMFSDYLNEANTLVCQVLPEHVRFAGFVGDFSWMKRGLRDHRFGGLVRKVRVRRPVLVSRATKPADVTHSLACTTDWPAVGSPSVRLFLWRQLWWRCCVHVRRWWRVCVRVYPVVCLSAWCVCLLPVVLWSRVWWRSETWCVRVLLVLRVLLAGWGPFGFLHLFLKLTHLLSQFGNLVPMNGVYVHGFLSVTVSSVQMEHFVCL